MLYLCMIGTNVYSPPYQFVAGGMVLVFYGIIWRSFWGGGFVCNPVWNGNGYFSDFSLAPCWVGPSGVVTLEVFAGVLFSGSSVLCAGAVFSCVTLGSGTVVV